MEYNISLKNSNKNWEEVEAEGCINFLRQNNGLTDDQICQAIKSLVGDQNTEDFRAQDEPHNLAYWIINAGSIETRSEYILELLVNENWCRKILIELTKQDSNIVLEEIN